MAHDPLQILLNMRMAILAAQQETVNYGYPEFNERMEAMLKESKELFRLFDKSYSD
jgi:hypothetical protein